MVSGVCTGITIHGMVTGDAGGDVRALAAGERGQLSPVGDTTVRPRSARGARSGRDRPGRGHRRDSAQVSRRFREHKSRTGTSIDRSKLLAK